MSYVVLAVLCPACVKQLCQLPPGRPLLTANSSWPLTLARLNYHDRGGGFRSAQVSGRTGPLGSVGGYAGGYICKAIWLY